MAVKRQEKGFNTENDKMYRIQVYNKIAQVGLNLLDKSYYEISNYIENPDAILLRSHQLIQDQIPASVKAIGRAGAGVNNIPLEYCAKNNIVVFNTPGANANAVKELVIGMLFLAYRNTNDGINFVKTLTNESELDQVVEKNKSNFKGQEIKGKKALVIGLGAIGLMVANTMEQLGLEVYGYDPYISIQHAWGLSRQVQQVENLNDVLSQMDVISLHLPLIEQTNNFFNEEKINQCKDSAIVMNFSRAPIVDEKAMKAALDANQIHRYINDFPSQLLLNHPKVIATPHLGASTSEAEDNCAVMVCDQINNFLQYGNIKNSVNFPDCQLGLKKETCRLIIINTNKPNMVSMILSSFEAEHINISEMINKSKNGTAYNILEIDKTPSESLTQTIKKMDGVLSLRII